MSTNFLPYKVSRGYDRPKLGFGDGNFEAILCGRFLITSF